MNILITSAGRRVKIVEYFKEAVATNDGKIIATDCDINAPAIHFADAYEIVPRINHPDYLKTTLNICYKYNIDAIISLLDPELEFLAQNRKLFESKNIKLILSSLSMIEMAFNKYETYKYLKNHNVSGVPTYNSLDEVLGLLEENILQFPLVIKPARGSASIDLYFVESKEELHETFNKLNDPIIQPFCKEREFGIDVYVDMVSGELVDIFIKEKIRMRAGETDKSVSVHNSKIKGLVFDLISKTNFIGPIDIDCFEHNGQFYISEINPRFGGGYPHAYESGCNFMDYIIHNLDGKVNKPFENYRYEEDIVMMKYDRIKLIKK